MARKNPFANLMQHDNLGPERPVLEYAAQGASKTILTSIGEMAARADRLIEGETIVELDPAEIDASFVRDRLDTEGEDEEFAELLAAIRDRGQDSPILVRPHPTLAARYMVVFGHRRLKAARLLGRKVRAVVKDLANAEHVVAQGQENSARANLSFIEKASFAASLARLHYDDDNSVALNALGVDRATLSKMLSVAALPEAILKAIGVAKGVGRDRWYDLKIQLEKPARLEAALSFVRRTDLSNLTSEQRFYAVVGALNAARKAKRPSPPNRRHWAPADGALSAEMTSEGKRYVLAIKAKGPDAAAFGEFLSGRLSRIYEEFRQDASSTSHGD